MGLIGNLFFAILLIATSLNTTAAVNTNSDDPNLINDSLVTNLPCDQLTEENVLTFINRNEAFKLTHQIPERNFPGGLSHGLCWAFSLAQRRMFYMLRFGVADMPEAPSEETVNQALDLVGNRNHELSPIQISDSDLFNGRKDRYGFTWLQENNFFKSLTQGLRSSGRTFDKEIIHRQERRFFSPFNISLITGYRNRSEGANFDTMNTILKSMAQGRMPLLIIRMGRTIVHVVLVRDVAAIGENKYQLSLYDSNHPAASQEKIIYENNNFYASEVMEGQDFDHAATDPVGVFIRDEDDMNAIQRANFKYYSSLCARKKLQQ